MSRQGTFNWDSSSDPAPPCTTWSWGSEGVREWRSEGVREWGSEGVREWGSEGAPQPNTYYHITEIHSTLHFRTSHFHCLTPEPVWEFQTSEIFIFKVLPCKIYISAKLNLLEAILTPGCGYSNRYFIISLFNCTDVVRPNITWIMAQTVNLNIIDIEMYWTPSLGLCYFTLY